ncbi:MAG: superoxide dismutase family protein [Acidobacteria bacterium]|nr:superoxide dismutase family protein [Acidobacteriota bacterium]
MVPRIGVTLSALLLLLITVACTQQAPQQTEEPAAPPAASGASVTLQPTEGNTAAGTLSLMTMGEGVHFTGTVTGLPPGMHGFHIHETGDCSAPDGSSAGGHFNPGGTQHGAPDAPEHHAGDLGNIEADASGNAEVNIPSSGLTLGPGENSVMGKAVIVHAAADDFAQPAGNAGARLACGVIQADM